MLTRWLRRVPSGVHVLSLGAAEPGNFEEHLKALSYLGTEEGTRRVDEGEGKPTLPGFPETFWSLRLRHRARVVSFMSD